MGSYLYDYLENSDAQFQGYWAGIFNSAPTDFSKRVSIVIPALDADIAWENCRWMPRNSSELPNIGDSCLCIFDDNNELWAVSWWPQTFS